MRYRAYPEYKDSGVDWLGEVPSHWNIAGFKKYLKSIVDYRGRTPTKIDDGVFLVTARNIKNGIINYDLSTEFISDDEYQLIMRRGKPSIGEVLFTTEAPLGEVANIDNEQIALAQRIVKFSGKDNILNNFYLKYFIQSTQFQNGLMSYATGSTALGIKAERFVYLRQILPLYDEQAAISNFLDRETQKIDNLIAKQQNLIELLTEKRQAVISHAVTKGINPDVKMKDSGVEWLGEVPEHWDLVRGRFLFVKMERPPMVDDKIVTAYRDGEVTLRENRRLDGYTIAVKEIGYQRVLINDLVVHGMDAFAGAIGVSDSDGKCTPEYAVLNTIKDNYNAHYYAHVLRLMSNRDYIYVICPSVRERAPRFRFEKLKNVFLPTPPSKEQSDIVKYISNIYDKTESLIKKSLRMIDLLQERRTALISAAVTGKIDVRNA